MMHPVHFSILLLLHFSVCMAGCRGSVNNPAPEYFMQSDPDSANHSGMVLSSGTTYRPPFTYAVRGRFCILLYGDGGSGYIRECAETIRNNADRHCSDYIFVDTRTFGEEDLLRFRMDFPEGEGIYVISASGNLLQKSQRVSPEEGEAAISRVSEVNRIFNVNGIVEQEWASYTPPAVHETVRSNFFKLGTYGKVLVPSDFVLNGRASVFVFCTPGCIPCEKLKDMLWSATDTVFHQNSVDFYYVDHASDDQSAKHPWSQIRETSSMKTYSIEGMEYFPTVWVVSPNGTTTQKLDNHGSGDLTGLFENLRRALMQFSPSITLIQSNPVLSEKEKKEEPGTLVSAAGEDPGDGSFPSLFIEKVILADGQLCFVYEPQNNSTEYTLALEITSENGKKRIARQAFTVSAGHLASGILSMPFSSEGFKKNKNYRLSLLVTGGNEIIIKNVDRRFRTDSQCRASVNL